MLHSNTSAPITPTVQQTGKTKTSQSVDLQKESSGDSTKVFSRFVEGRTAPEPSISAKDNKPSGNGDNLAKTHKISKVSSDRTTGGLQITDNWGSELKCVDEVAALKQLFGLQKDSGFPLNWGNQGSVYCFSDKSEHRYAVKILKKASNPEDLQNKRSELCGLLLPEHQNIATTYALILKHKDKGNNTFVPIRNEKDIPARLNSQYGVKIVISEYVDGSDLFDAMIDDNARVKADSGPKLAILVAKQLVPVLQYIHEHDLFFQDIKPENIMITKSGEIKLVDFGLARYVPQGGRRYSCAGSLLYCAPEILNEMKIQKSERKGYTCKTDLWSLGITLGTLTLGENLDYLCNEYKGPNAIKPPAFTLPSLSNKEYTLWYSKLDEKSKRKLLLQELNKEVNPSTYSTAESNYVINIIIGLTREDPDKRMLLSEVMEQLNKADSPPVRRSLFCCVSA